VRAKADYVLESLFDCLGKSLDRQEKPVCSNSSRVLSASESSCTSSTKQEPGTLVAELHMSKQELAAIDQTKQSSTTA
jgi:hypothetical protein